ncbi:MAG: hypothetical protein AAF806_16740 [Bacteroidota bacterium]
MDIHIINYEQKKSGYNLQATDDLVNSGSVLNMGEALEMSSSDFHPFSVAVSYFPELF